MASGQAVRAAAVSLLAMASARLAKAAADLQAEQQRDGGPRPPVLRQIAGDLYPVAGDLLGAACDIEAERITGR